MKEKSTIINISFQTKSIEDVILLDWLQEKFKEYGKSRYVKKVLREKMYEEENFSKEK